MKKKVLFGIFFIALLISLTFIVAQENVTDAQIKVDKAYACLESKVTGKCSSLAPQEKIFALLAIGKCQDEVVAASNSGMCWPGGGCTLKDTAQAVLALSKTSVNTQEAEEWLLSQNASPSDVDWYLQIESDKQTKCTITYDGMGYPVVLKEDKTFNTNAGTCLRLSNDDLWFKIATGCYNKEYKISCDEAFKTNLLFKKGTSSTIFVSDKTHSASALGATNERVNSVCFIQGGKCNYEGSLWAALVLKTKGYDISAYLPYLTTTAEENREYLPESFLYALTSQDDYRIELLLKQKSSKFWNEAGNKFYDTSVALYSISDEPAEKLQSKQWLLEVQDADGCWLGNVRDTAFILASVWPKTFQSGVQDCVSLGGYCMAEASCTGTILSNYRCSSAILKCCDTATPLRSCLEQVGIVCNSGQSCVGGVSSPASGINIGETCCLGGTCEVVQTQNECEDYQGTCRSFGCNAGEIESQYQCDFGDTCCTPGASQASYWWIWILLLLIILAVLAIVFKDKLRPYWFKIVSLFKRKGSPGVPSGAQQPSMPMRRYIPRRILPPSQRPAPRPAPASNTGLNDVLKRLKEMSK